MNNKITMTSLMFINNKFFIALFVFLATSVPAFAGDIMTEVLIEGTLVFAGIALGSIAALAALSLLCTFIFKAFGYFAVVAFIIFLKIMVILYAI